MTTDELQRLMEALDDLGDFREGNDPATFAQDRDPRVVREAITAWDAVNALSEVFLSKLKAAQRHSGPLTRACSGCSSCS